MFNLFPVLSTANCIEGGGMWRSLHVVANILPDLLSVERSFIWPALLARLRHLLCVSRIRAVYFKTMLCFYWLLHCSRIACPREQTRARSDHRVRASHWLTSLCLGALDLHHVMFIWI